MLKLLNMFLIQFSSIPLNPKQSKSKPSIPNETPNPCPSSKKEKNHRKITARRFIKT